MALRFCNAFCDFHSGGFPLRRLPLRRLPLRRLPFQPSSNHLAAPSAPWTGDRRQATGDGPPCSELKATTFRSFHTTSSPSSNHLALSLRGQVTGHRSRVTGHGPHCCVRWSNSKDKAFRLPQPWTTRSATLGQSAKAPFISSAGGHRLYFGLPIISSPHMAVPLRRQLTDRLPWYPT